MLRIPYQGSMGLGKRIVIRSAELRRWAYDRMFPSSATNAKSGFTEV